MVTNAAPAWQPEQVIDVLFGAIAAIALEKYEPVVRAAWTSGLARFSVSVFVAICICSFFVYDVAVFHVLVKKYPYRMTVLGFLRFYLDVVMAFVLFLLLSDALNASPNWFTIIVTVTFWHIAAVVWYLLACTDQGVFKGAQSALIPHPLFVAVYWLVMGTANAIGRYAGLAEALLSTVLLLAASATILCVSLFRWNQVIRKVAPQFVQPGT